MKKLLIQNVVLASILFCALIIVPLLTSAETPRTRPDNIQERLDARLAMLLGQVCDRITGMRERGIPILIPAFCVPPPPPPVDMCLNVPGLQESGPCADVQCTEAGGTWNGASCDMPPPPPVDVCPNVPGMQESGPCADAECVEDGGTWNGTSCDMPPPPPVDVCPNVPGDQAAGPCADVECVEDGGTWNGASCDMPPPPEGSVVINEIMYDLPGTDGTREWIEVMNGTDGMVDLSTWTLFESETNRALTLIMGSATLPAGGFAIIAANTDSFLADWPDFEGTLFDTTSFSLLNTTETLVLKNGAGETIDEVTYSSTDGAEGDGNSLQLIDEDWVAAPPTPGAVNVPLDAS